MASAVQRFWNVLKGKIDESLDEIEDPQGQLMLFVEELDTQIEDLRKAVAIPLTQEKRLKLQIEERLAQANEWENRAVYALEEGDEDLARQALLKKEDLEASALELQKEWEHQAATARKLQGELQLAMKKVEEAKRKYSLLVARQQSAMARKKIVQITASSGEQSPNQLMARLNEKILSIEAETATHLELSGEGLGDDLEAKFHDLDRRRRGDRALNELKATLEKRKLGGDRVLQLKAKLDED